jgi:sulfane dehydrogenase subunit SoxC
MTAITRRPPIVGRYTFEELALASRNAGMPLEALRHDVTPIGLHYQLIHFDIPDLGAAGLAAAHRRPRRARARAVAGRSARPAGAHRNRTMECAGNGRAQVSPRYPSIPWVEEGVSTAQWTGHALAEVVRAAGLRPQAKQVVFWGADRGIDRGLEHAFARSLVPAEPPCQRTCCSPTR